MTEEKEALVVTVKQAQQIIRKQLGAAPSTSAMYRLIQDQKLQGIKLAGKVLIIRNSLSNYLSYVSIGI